jgi:hypothetical protein
MQIISLSYYISEDVRVLGREPWYKLIIYQGSLVLGIRNAEETVIDREDRIMKWNCCDDGPESLV